MRTKIKSSFLAFLFSFFIAYPTYAYVDQIWLQSPKSIKTMFDVKVFSIVRNLYLNQTLIDPEDQTWARAYLLEERNAFLEHIIVNQYISDNRITLEIDERNVDQKAKEMLAQLEDEKQKKAIFETWGLSENDIHQWVYDRMALEKFLQTHRPFQPIETDQKIQEYYDAHRDGRFLDKPLDEVRELVIQDYRTSFLRVEFKKWLDQEIRRQKWKVHD